MCLKVERTRDKSLEEIEQDALTGKMPDVFYLELDSYGGSILLGTLHKIAISSVGKLPFWSQMLLFTLYLLTEDPCSASFFNTTLN